LKPIKRVLVLVLFVIGVIAAIWYPFFRGRNTSQDDYGDGGVVDGDDADGGVADSKAAAGEGIAPGESSDRRVAHEKVPGRDVARVMMKCPETGKPVFTGLSMEKETFKFADFSGATISPCPACGKAHSWEKEDAFVEGN
jgi:endogenous inhibitor of DNA gyrase (YacG/DUF329 family)